MTHIITTCACGRALTLPFERQDGQCWHCSFPAIAPATKQCQCGAPLISLVEQWTLECSACCPPSLECRVPLSSAHIAGISARARARDMAREAAFGVDIEFELSQVGPEPDDLERPGPAGHCAVCDGVVLPDERVCWQCSAKLGAAS